MSELARAVEAFDPSDYERPAKKPGVRGSIRLDRATLHVDLRPNEEPTEPAWLGAVVLETKNENADASFPVRFKAATPRETWSAISAWVGEQLGVFR